MQSIRNSTLFVNFHFVFKNFCFVFLSAKKISDEFFQIFAAKVMPNDVLAE